MLATFSDLLSARHLILKPGDSYNPNGHSTFQNGRSGSRSAFLSLSLTVLRLQLGFSSLIWCPGTLPLLRLLSSLLMPLLVSLALLSGSGRPLPLCGKGPLPSLLRFSSSPSRSLLLLLAGAAAAPCMFTSRSLGLCSSLSPLRWLVGSLTSARASTPLSTGVPGVSPNLVDHLGTFDYVSTTVPAHLVRKRHFINFFLTPCPWAIGFATSPWSRRSVTSVLTRFRRCVIFFSLVLWHSVSGRTSALCSLSLRQSLFSRLPSLGLPIRRF